MSEMLIIIGASGHGKVVADIATRMGVWKNISFLDDDESIGVCLGYKVIGKTNEFERFKNEADYFVAIGNNSIRQRFIEMLIDNDISLVSLYHPSAIIASEVEVDIGTVVMPGVVINNSCRIGKGCIINTSSSLDHDNLIEDYVHISPGTNIAGTVTVGKLSWIGIGSTISNNIEICCECVVGAGSVVLNDIIIPGTYVGSPARRVIK